MTAEGTYPKLAGDIFYPSEVNKLYNRSNNIWTKIMYKSSANNGIIAFSTTTWSTSADRTTDSGATWSGDGYGADCTAAASGAKGISIVFNDATDSNFTIDSGANWSVSSTDPDLDTHVNCCDISGSVAVCGGLDGGGNNAIYYSSDGGDNWAECTTGPTAQVTAIALASATVGYAIDVANNVWKTVDSGDNWSDTGDNLAYADVKIVCIDVDTVFVVRLFERGVYVYDNTGGGTVTTLRGLWDDAGNDDIASNPALATNGNVYWVQSISATASGDDVNTMYHLYRWDGTFMYIKPLGEGWTVNPENDCFGNVDGNIYNNVPSLTEGDTNKLLCNVLDNVLEIDVSGD